MKRIVYILIICTLVALLLSSCVLYDFFAGNIYNDSSIDDELISELVNYLECYNNDYELEGNIVEERIDKLKSGTQGIHVAFDSSDYYFVGGYCKPIHQNESHDYCCAKEYTWLRFDSEQEIKESYKGLNLVVVFQINRAKLVNDILTDKTDITTFEHFQIYTPSFNNGVNINVPITFDYTYIYLNSSNQTAIYHSKFSFFDEYIMIPCICLADNYYVKTELYTLSSDGNMNESGSYILGKHYETLLKIMEEEHYVVENKNGSKVHFGLIDIEAFVDFIEE